MCEEIDGYGQLSANGGSGHSGGGGGAGGRIAIYHQINHNLNATIKAHAGKVTLNYPFMSKLVQSLNVI